MVRLPKYPCCQLPKRSFHILFWCCWQWLINLWILFWWIVYWWLSYCPHLPMHCWLTWTDWLFCQTILSIQTILLSPNHHPIDCCFHCCYWKVAAGWLLGGETMLNTEMQQRTKLGSEEPGKKRAISFLVDESSCKLDGRLRNYKLYLDYFIGWILDFFFPPRVWKTGFSYLGKKCFMHLSQ